MAYTTTTALVSTITGMSVTGIKTTQAFRPRQVNAGQLPMLFPRLPEPVSGETSTLNYSQGLKRANIEVVIMAHFINLNTQATNDALVRTLIDNLVSALETNAASLGLDGYTIVTDEDTLDGGDRPIQLIVATLEVSG